MSAGLDRRTLLPWIGGSAIALAVGAAVLWAVPAALAAADSADDAAEGTLVELAPIVAGWPAEYSVSGTKSEALYVEHISSARSGDVFALEIDVVAQGNAAGGVQHGAVRVGADGAIEWLVGCTKTDPELCADDRALRGFLSAAAVLSAERRGELPASATLRSHDGVAVVCVDDAALHPDVAPATSGLDPCFSERTGALLAHYSAASAAFVGPTIAAGGLVDAPVPAPQLLETILSGA